jgi:methyl-accepting chemotaxis protein
VKLGNSIVLSFLATTSVAIFCITFYFVFSNRNIMQEDIQAKALVLVHTFESQLGAGYEQENAEGVNEVFGAALQALKTTVPSIQEINIYKVPTAKAVASNVPDMVGKDVDPEDIKAAKDDKIVVLFEQEKGQEIIDVTSPLHHEGSIDYVMGIKQNIQDDYKRINEVFLKTLLIGAVLVALIALVASVIARRISKPILMAGASFRELAEGEADLSKRLDDGRKDEIGALATDFNSFVVKLVDIVKAIKAAQGHLDLMAAELKASSEETVKSISRIASNVEGAKATAATQADVVINSASAIEEIAKNIESMDGTIAGQAAGVAQASAAVEEMIASIASVFQSMERMGEQFGSVSAAVVEGKVARDEAASLVTAIADRSRSLQDANSTIASIASRTNLLAMNAAIEAAHAGEAGKGFSVVADEIRKLAENSAEQSRVIKQDIGEVRKSIDEVVQSTDRLGKAFGNVEGNISETGKLVDEIRHSVSEQSQGSTEILKLLSSLNSITVQVRDGSAEMAEGNSTLLEGTTRLRVATESMGQDIDAIARGMAALAEIARGEVDISNKAGTAIDTMEAVVGRFKV